MIKIIRWLEHRRYIIKIIYDVQKCLQSEECCNGFTEDLLELHRNLTKDKRIMNRLISESVKSWKM